MSSEVAAPNNQLRATKLVCVAAGRRLDIESCNSIAVNTKSKPFFTNEPQNRAATS